MSLGLFTYDILLLAANTMVLVLFSAAYLQRREDKLLWVAFFMAGCVLDHCLFFAEEVSPGLWSLGKGWAWHLLRAVTTVCIMLGTSEIEAHIFDRKLRMWEYALIACCPLASVLGFSPVARYAPVVARLYITYIWIDAIYRIARKRNDISGGRLRWMLLLILLVSIPSTFSPLLPGSNRFYPLDLGIRDFANEFINVCYLVLAIFYLWRIFKRPEPEEVQIPVQLDIIAAEHGLTAREREIMGMIFSGKTNNAIANELWISPGTVKTHAHRIYHKVGVANRDELRRLIEGKRQPLSL